MRSVGGSLSIRNPPGDLSNRRTGDFDFDRDLVLRDLGADFFSNGLEGSFELFSFFFGFSSFLGSSSSSSE